MSNMVKAMPKQAVISWQRRLHSLAFLLFLSPGFGQVNVLTWHNDNQRTGQNLAETILTPTNINSSTFGRIFTLSVDGKVDAQPLYVAGGPGSHNVLYVATEHDSVYAFDADTGTQLWQVSLLGTGETTSDGRGCGQVIPEIGITSTPAIDTATGAIYVVAMSKNGSAYHQRLHALSLTNGHEMFGGPVDVQATYPGHGAGSAGGTVTFDPKQYKERSALLIQNGVLYTSWASHCDIAPYTAWVIAYNETTLARTSVLNLTPNGNDGAMWNAGSGPAADAGGYIYVLTGNGTFDPALDASGLPMNGDYGNAFVKMWPSNSGLSAVDYFTMSNTVSESNSDTDLGSGGLLLIPPAATGSVSLAVGAGKDGHLYVVDTNNMGKFSSGGDVIYQELPGALGPVFSSPAWFNGKLYYGSVGSALKAFAFVNGSFLFSPASQTSSSFGFPGATPSISANGTSNGIVWAAENGSTAVLHAYDAANLSRELYNSNQASNGRDQFGSGNKFIVPTVANGKVYIGTENSVGVFGLLCTNSISAPSANFSATGGTAAITVTPTGAACSWSAASNVNWISVTSGASGTGAGVVNLSVDANTGAARTSTLTIAGQSFTVTQAALLLSGITSPSTGSQLPGTSATFAWSAVPAADQYRLDAGTSQGQGDISSQVTAAQSVTISNIPCDGRTIFVQLSTHELGAWQTPVQYTYQAATGCTTPAAFDSPGVSLSSGGGSGTVGVIANLGWTAAANVDWIAITSGASGTGSGTIAYSVAANPSSTQRVGMITIGPAVFTITEATAAGARFVPVTPCRVADTRNAGGSFGGPAVAANNNRTFAIPQSSCGIPATAVAYSLNVTAVPQGPLSYLTIWPAGQNQPFVSTLNSADGRVVANAAIVPAGSNGAVSVFATNQTDVVLDINGYFDAQNPAAMPFYPVTPCRVADTRNSSGLFGGPPIGDGTLREFALPQSSCAIPPNSGAYALNVTAVPDEGLNYLTTWPAGRSQPFVSTLNSFDGSVVANAAIVPAGTNGSIDVFASNRTDVVLDVSGFFASSAAGSKPLSFYPVPPCRVADTRNPAGTFGGPAIGGLASRNFPIPTSACGIPATARAYSLNVTAVPQGILNYLTIWPAGQSRPFVSTLNSLDGRILANAAIVQAGSNGSVSVFVTDPTDVVLDINGYFAP